METPNRSRRRKNESPAEGSSKTSITDFPEAILIYILSFLPTPAAIKTSAVASPWRNLWCSLPSLEFDMHYFQRRNPGNLDSEDRVVFASLVSRAFRRRPINLPIQKFKLLFYYRNYDLIRDVVDVWVQLLVLFRAVEVDLEFVDYGMGIDDDEVEDDEEEDFEDDFETYGSYDFHFSKIVSSSIEVLKLSGCYLKFPSKKLCMKLNSIKELHLGDFHGWHDEIEQLMDSCVNLETFVLSYSGASPQLNIVSNSMRHLTFNAVSDLDNDKTSVEICTPKLESIEIGGFCCGMYSLTDVSSLVEANIDFRIRSLWDFACWTNVISSLSGIEHLASYNFFVQDEFSPKTCDDVRILIEQEDSEDPLHPSKYLEKLKFGEKVFLETFAFHNLKDLTLKTGYLEGQILGLEVWCKKCPRLETLVLVCYGYTQVDDQLEEDEIADSPITFQIPRLREVRMEGYLGTSNELFVVDLLKKHGQVLEKIMAFPAKVGKTSPAPFLL